jgi:hypothetical protein
MFVNVALQLGSVWTADPGTVVELTAGTFWTGKESMRPKGSFFKAFPTTRTLRIVE